MYEEIVKITDDQLRKLQERENVTMFQFYLEEGVEIFYKSESENMKSTYRKCFELKNGRLNKQDKNNRWVFTSPFSEQVSSFKTVCVNKKQSGKLTYKKDEYYLKIV